MRRPMSAALAFAVACFALFQNDPPRNEFMLNFLWQGGRAGVSIAHVRELQKRNQRFAAMLEGIEKMANQHQSNTRTNPTGCSR